MKGIIDVQRVLILVGYPNTLTDDTATRPSKPTPRTKKTRTRTPPGHKKQKLHGDNTNERHHGR